ncbi:MAG: hypothetical protein CL528_00460 [Aequorivita sp.]|jgi:hypothetical protein|nr:hypothetical protein [Aequorivita sp.]MBP40222.1 hypothetical protein [Aequorivita sp.]|tara:strand:+ start:1665 stop:2018 length:354 start_codon:yes stop_codon:yes gene_type:complete
MDNFNDNTNEFEADNGKIIPISEIIFIGKIHETTCGRFAFYILLNNGHAHSLTMSKLSEIGNLQNHLLSCAIIQKPNYSCEFESLNGGEYIVIPKKEYISLLFTQRQVDIFLKNTNQ